VTDVMATAEGTSERACTRRRRTGYEPFDNSIRALRAEEEEEEEEEEETCATPAAYASRLAALNSARVIANLPW